MIYHVLRLMIVSLNACNARALKWLFLFERTHERAPSLPLPAGHMMHDEVKPLSALNLPGGHKCRTPATQ